MNEESLLTARQRLGLFVPVCEAVRHAHTRGVIHRDLKPSNILVEAHDGRPVVKVVDFGLAKATGPRLAGQAEAMGGRRRPSGSLRPTNC
jgi:serine/threonine protein kinase